MAKAKIKDFWYEVVQDGMEEQTYPSTDHTSTSDWWKSFDMGKKQETYGKRVGVLERVGCRLFKTSSFKEVILFLIRYEQLDPEKDLQTLIEQRKPKVRVKIAARKMIRLKAVFGGSWSQLYKLAGGLKRISKGAIQCASQKEVVKTKRLLKCPRIYEHINPATRKAGA